MVVFEYVGSEDGATSLEWGVVDKHEEASKTSETSVIVFTCKLFFLRNSRVMEIDGGITGKGKKAGENVFDNKSDWKILDACQEFF